MRAQARGWRGPDDAALVARRARTGAAVVGAGDAPVPRNDNDPARHRHFVQPNPTHSPLRRRSRDLVLFEVRGLRVDSVAWVNGAGFVRREVKLGQVETDAS